MIQDILAFAMAHVDAGNKVALITVTKTEGSSPASPGQVMAVLVDGTSAGTVGGGASEHSLIQLAMQSMQNNEPVFSFEFDHSKFGMVCGGSMSGFGNVLGSENHLLIFGGGHIAQSLAPLALSVGFSVTVVEDRPELESAFSGVRYVVCVPSEYESKLPSFGNTFAVVCTRGHKTDDDALRFCLSQSLRYLGMIGSSKKVAGIMQTLKQEGYSKETLADIYAPIGLNVASGMPPEIAVSILAEILLVKNKGSAQHKKDAKN